MKHILIQPSFDSWREAARNALHLGYEPGELDLQDAASTVPLILALEPDQLPSGIAFPRPHTSKAFLDHATLVAVHRDSARWNLLYRILYRLQTSRELLNTESDPDVVELLRLAAQVRSDLNRMQAFVRFHKVLQPGEPSFPGEQTRPIVLDEPLIPIDAAVPDPHHLVLATPTLFGVVRTDIEQCTPNPEGCEHFIAWFQPDHRVLPLAASFFADRYAIMHWTILTPDASVSWIPDIQQLVFGPGIPRDSEPSADELESLWRSYYASRSIPARSNPPIKQPDPKATSVLTRQQQSSAKPFLPEDQSIASLTAALPYCKGCELYCHAKQVVPGAGNPNSPIMLVGEQPGDQEDVQGFPFVGPAGKVLDRALADLRIDRSSLYLTNAVKHFKFIQRGKLRLHQNPRMSEIMACRPWLLAEIEAIRPKVVLCLGASAAKSLLGGTFALMKDRGKLLDTPLFGRVMATIHPSAILRARDQQTAQQLLEFLKEDLAHAQRVGQP